MSLICYTVRHLSGVDIIKWLDMVADASKIDVKDLAQVNATVIIGLFVLLGVSNLIPSGQVVSNRTGAMIATEVFVIPFSAALVAALYGRLRTSKHLTVLGILIVVVGLLILIFVGP
jgi:hypothetical protein